MNILENISLKPYNTFGIDVNARYFVEVTTEDELIKILSLTQFPNIFLLGGGSNMLLLSNINALVIYINNKGKKIVKETQDYVYVKANAGEKWHDLVLWAVNQDFGGIENLSLIPGNCGSAPIQNIGAYGVELKDVFISCNTINIKTKEKHNYTLQDCHFGYRDSIFKNKLKGEAVITSITLKLTKKQHLLKTAYGAIQEELSIYNIKDPSVKNISDAVIAIRQSKLPDPKKLGNSGSFFKNPVVSKTAFNTLLIQHPEIPHYKINEDEFKIPAGWLIEQCGFKGKRLGNTGVHQKQALVLVNYGNATGTEILNLAKHIQETVQKNFSIHIEPEVNIIS